MHTIFVLCDQGVKSRPKVRMCVCQCRVVEWRRRYRPLQRPVITAGVIYVSYSVRVGRTRTESLLPQLLCARLRRGCRSRCRSCRSERFCSNDRAGSQSDRLVSSCGPSGHPLSRLLLFLQTSETCLTCWSTSRKSNTLVTHQRRNDGRWCTVCYDH